MEGIEESSMVLALGRKMFKTQEAHGSKCFFIFGQYHNLYIIRDTYKYFKTSSVFGNSDSPIFHVSREMEKSDYA